MDEAERKQILADIALEGGGLIEIYALGTNLRSWKLLVEYFKNKGYVKSFTKAGIEAGAAVETEFFDSSSDVVYSLSLEIDGQTWTTSFVAEENIDLQGDPEEVKTPEDLTVVINLMHDIKRVTGKRVVLVPETQDPAATRPYIAVG